MRAIQLQSVVMMEMISNYDVSWLISECTTDLLRKQVKQASFISISEGLTNFDRYKRILLHTIILKVIKENSSKFLHFDDRARVNESQIKAKTRIFQLTSPLKIDLNKI